MSLRIGGMIQRKTGIEKSREAVKRFYRRYQGRTKEQREDGTEGNRIRRKESHLALLTLKQGVDRCGELFPPFEEFKLKNKNVAQKVAAHLLD